MTSQAQESSHVIQPTFNEGAKRSTREESLVSPPRLPAATVPDTSAAEPDTDIDGSFTMILRVFKKLKVTENTSVDDVDKRLWENKQLAGDNDLVNVSKKGAENVSFLHFLLKTPTQIETNILLLKWAMEKFPDLYLKGVSEGKSILHTLTTKSKAIRDIGPLRTFVELYPAQVAAILERTRKDLQGQLLSDILPAIQTSAPPQFLKFFGQCPEESEPRQCNCPDCLPKRATQLERNGSDSNQSERPTPSSDSNVTSEEIGDVIILRWPKELPDQITSHVRKPPTKETPHPGTVGDEEDQTPLHLAAGLRQCTERQYTHQFRLVKHLFSWCPEALEKVNKDGQSPYLHRTANYNFSSTTERRQQVEDDIAFFLKDQIMHLPDRDNVLDLLYGRSKGPRPLALPGSGGSKREIHLDLSEVQMSASSSARKDDLLHFIRSLEFENILQYVQIPQYPFRKPGTLTRLPPADGVETKPDKDGMGRRDFKDIFDVLKQKGVRKVLRLVVDDDDACLHQDDVIQQTLSDFEIEEFQWRKMDLSSLVLRHAVPRARTLRLFSSGNHSVLREWSSADGLNQLGLLRSVYVKVYWKTESRATTEKYAKDFITRLIANAPQLRAAEVRLEPFTAKKHEEWPNRNLLVTTNKWLQTMQRFATFVNNVQRLSVMGEERGPPAVIPNEVRVAVLDDGIDWSFAKSNRCYGMSFYPDKRSDFEGHKVWYSSSTDHGTLMAALIEKICPGVTLFIARLDQTESEQGEFQPTPESAAKAIDWAIQMNVHIISMSWTIPGAHPCLDKAVKEARGRGILMFGSASDQGAKTAEMPYMAKLVSGGKGSVICIGGARDIGLADERARSEGEFFFPGQTNGIPAPLPPLKSNFGAKTGSSVATALAVGLTALIMLLVDMSSTYGPNAPTISKLAPSYRKDLQDPMNIRVLFKSLLQQSDMSGPSGESRNDIIIPVQRYFRCDRLNNKLLKAPADKRGEKGKKLLDNDVLKRILRVLINKNEDKEATTETDEEQDEEEE